MVNRQRSNPGNLQSVAGRARISQDVPGFAVDTGAGFQALASVAGSLATRLGKLANDAAAREGALAGLSEGQSSGVGYLQAREVERRAEARKSAAPANAKAVKGYLMTAHGFTDAQASGIVGNLIQESRLIPNGKPGDAGTAFGIAQWRGDRLTALKSFAASRGKPWTDLHTQLDFVAHELETSERTAGASLRAATTVEAATEAFIAFERPRGFTRANPRGGHGFSNRLAHARRLAGTGVSAPARNEGPAVKPLQLRRDGTIRGEAMDQAAMRAYAWRVEEGISRDLAAADLELSDDPAALNARLEEIRVSYLQEEAFQDPQLREVFDRAYEKRVSVYRLKAAAAQERRVLAQESAATTEALSARLVDIERQAFALGANPDGDAALTEQLDRVGSSIDSAIDAGVYTAAQGSKLKADFAEAVARGRIQGTFEALETPGAKEAFALGLMDDWAAGTGPLAKLPLDSVKAISTTLFNRARAEANSQASEARATKARIDQLIDDDIASIAATGQPLDLEAAGTDMATIEAALTPVELFAWQSAREQADRLYQATAGMEGQSEADIATRLEALQPQPGQGGFTGHAAAYAGAQKRAAEILEERELDPLGQAQRAGIVELAPIAAESAEELDQFFAQRAVDARTVAQVYGTPLRVFRPGEAAALAGRMLERPELLPAFASGIRTAFGRQAATALAEISEDGPVMAHAAGISLANGDTSVAIDVARALSFKADKTYTLKMPSQSQFVEAAGPHMQSALAALPRTSAAAIGTAALLYENYANRQGFDPDDILKEDTPAAEAWRKSLNRATGGNIVNGRHFGGIGEVNGGNIVVPSDMPTDRPAEILSDLTDEQFSFLPPIASGNGVPFSARQLRRATLITVGDGLYRVATGDPFSQEPQFLATPDGRFWTLDIRFLERLQNQ